MNIHKVYSLGLISWVGMILLSLLVTVGYSQCAKVTDNCIQFIKPYQSEGQYYRAQLFPEEEAKLKVTFFSRMAYRIVPCGKSSTNSPLIFTIFDKNGVFIYTNKDEPNKTHYDFTFGATGPYQIRARYESGEGCAALLVGYLEEDKAAEILKK